MVYTRYPLEDRRYKTQIIKLGSRYSTYQPIVPHFFSFTIQGNIPAVNATGTIIMEEEEKMQLLRENPNSSNLHKRICPFFQIIRKQKMIPGMIIFAKIDLPSYVLVKRKVEEVY